MWDRRCFIAKGKPAGVLVGHLEGITFLDTRGDGRYFISNGKDQAIKLWDIRKMSSNATAWYCHVRASFSLQTHLFMLSGCKHHIVCITTEAVSSYEQFRA